MRMILASGSPRRSMLLRELGLDFEVLPPDINEERNDWEPAEDYVHRMATEKALAGGHQGPALIVAADTIVVLDGDILGKPANEAEARSALRKLSGRDHRVLSAVALRRIDGELDRTVVETTETTVRIAALDENEIAWYAATGEGSDKAGAYAIQGIGAVFVERIRGNYTNVVGLPMPSVLRQARELGVDLLACVSG